LNLGHLSSSPIAAVLVLPLPVHSSDDSGAWEDATNGDLLRFSPRLHQYSEVKEKFLNKRKNWLMKIEKPFTAESVNAIETMPQMMFVPVVTDTTQVVVRAFSALPANAKNWLLPANEPEC